MLWGVLKKPMTKRYTLEATLFSLWFLANIEIWSTEGNNSSELYCRQQGEWKMLIIVYKVVKMVLELPMIL